MENSEVETLKTYLNETASDAAVCTKLVESINQRLRSGELDVSSGIDFLSLRNHFLLDYLINIIGLSQCKLNGRSIQNSPWIDRLIALRLYLEKGQNIYGKMHHQIEKILSFGRDPLKIQDNPLLLRPKPHNLTGLDDADESEEDFDEEEEEKQKRSSSKSKVYKPPRIAPVRFEQDDDAEETKRKLVEKAKKRALSSSIMHELRSEYDEGPEEIKSGSVRQRKVEKKLDEIRRYEEENFTRINLSKKEKQAMKRSLMTTGTLSGDITGFGDTSFLDDDLAAPSSSRAPKTKKKVKVKSKYGRKTKKRRNK